MWTVQVMPGLWGSGESGSIPCPYIEGRDSLEGREPMAFICTRAIFFWNWFRETNFRVFHTKRQDRLVPTLGGS